MVETSIAEKRVAEAKTPEQIAQHLLTDWQYMMSDGSVSWEDSTAMPQLQQGIADAIAAERAHWQAMLHTAQTAYLQSRVESDLHFQTSQQARVALSTAARLAMLVKDKADACRQIKALAKAHFGI